MILRPEVFWLLSRGSAVVTTRSGSLQVRPGQALYAAAGMRAQHFSPGTVLFSIGMEVPDNVTHWLGPPALHVVDPGHRVRSLTERLCRRTVSIQPAPGPWAHRLVNRMRAPAEDWLRLEALFLRWRAAVVAMARRAGAAFAVPEIADARVRWMLATIAGEPWGPASAPAALAEAVGLSRRRLEQVVRASTGLGIAELRAHHRLAQAKQLLRTPGTAVKAVAATLGFRTSTAFVLWFRRHAGCPPRRWLLAREI
jgi:AraC-like DNA-binding protein